uniref:Uncharacterized protein n=2 Tax=Ciona intestinalis TaxID=7719 RepID=F6WAE9_CIOIN
MDKLQEQMCVSQPTNIAVCFERQIQRHKELQAMVNISMERKAHLTEVLDGILESLDDKKRCHQSLLEDTAAKKAEFYKCIAESSRTLRERSSRSDLVDRLILDVSNSTEHIRHKVASSNWLKLKLKKHGYEMPTTLDTSALEVADPFEDPVTALNACADQLNNLTLEMANRAEENPDDTVAEEVLSDCAQDLLVSMRASAPQNVRIVIAVDEDILPAEDFLCDDDDDNDEYLSREAIQNTMRELTETATMRKKRRRQRKAKK